MKIKVDATEGAIYFLVSRQHCNVVNNVIYFLHNQPGRIDYEEIHRNTYQR
jgi:hypothetical protein